MSESEFYDGVYSYDLRREQRYVIERLNDYWAIYSHPVQGIETRAEAEELLQRFIRGESLMD